MTSKTVAALLADLKITRSHSRPQVSNNIPYSSSGVQDYEVFTARYKDEHRHTGIGLRTPADVHFVWRTAKRQTAGMFSLRLGRNTLIASTRRPNQRSSICQTNLPADESEIPEATEAAAA